MHPPETKSIVIGTAGHIDHGKTALVKALTGIDADRLEEEKRRGITIDIGFAHLRMALPGGQRLDLAFVDVPGHERFVRNMLAGAGGIDVVLFVIAADESIKPQTREHFEICRLLNIRRGITVLTKADLVDADTLEVVRMEVEEFLRGSFLDPGLCAVIPVSARTGAGIEELKAELVKVAESVAPRDAGAVFRLPIDRVFAMKGFGTVVTGTLVSGRVAKEDEVEVLPSAVRLRVRGVQVQGEVREEARAGERTALNLSSVSTAELARGMTLVAPDTLETTRLADVRLSLLAGAKPLRDGSRVHLHAYTSETVAQVFLRRTSVSAAKEAPPGEAVFARMRLRDPLLLLPGDRFIIRQFSPVVTIGGGVVLDAFPMTKNAGKKAPVQQTVTFLETLDEGSPEKTLFARIARRGVEGISLAEAVKETGWQPAIVENAASAMVRNTPAPVVRILDRWLASRYFEDARNKAVESVGGFHAKNPLVAGIGKEELRARLHLSPEIFPGVLDSVLAAGRLAIDGEQVRLPGRAIVMKDEEAGASREIEAAFEKAGLKVPALKEVLGNLPVDRARAQKIVTLLLRERKLVKLSDELVFHHTALQSLRTLMAKQKAINPSMDVATFKELSGVSRKYAIPLLEYLDRERVTRRAGDRREIL